MDKNRETQWEIDVREGRNTNPEKDLQYHIDKFNQGDSEKPVKVTHPEAKDREHVSGFFTQQKFIIGRTPQEMEKDLGLKHGELGNGATIYELSETPNARQFVPAGYTHMPDGRFYEEGGEHPVGAGAIQFKLKEDIPAKVIGKVKSNEPWVERSVKEKESVINQPENNELDSDSVKQAVQPSEDASDSNSENEQDEEYYQGISY